MSLTDLQNNWDSGLVYSTVYIGLYHTYELHSACSLRLRPNKIVIILQTFPRKKMFVFSFKYPVEFVSKDPIITMGSANGLVRNGRQTVTWTIVDQVDWRRMASMS